LAGIRLHPIKSLDHVDVTEARIGPNGGLELDRAWALYTVDGQWVRGKRTAAIHLIRAAFAPDVSAVTLSVPGDRRKIPTRTFAFPGETESASEWFSVYFEQQIIVRYARGGFPDDDLAAGPTIISTATLQAVSEWFPGLTFDEARRRFRTTLEIAAGQFSPTQNGLPPFWEDRLFAEDERNVVRFRIGEVAFEGSNPCARCVVPSRDTQTGVAHFGAATNPASAAAVPAESAASFQKRFTESRRAHLPPWAPAARFDHFYRLAVNTRVASTEAGKLLRLGDPLTLE
jgi:uncharacterized protein YcbX